MHIKADRSIFCPQFITNSAHCFSTKATDTMSPVHKKTWNYMFIKKFFGMFWQNVKLTHVYSMPDWQKTSIQNKQLCCKQKTKNKKVIGETGDPQSILLVFWILCKVHIFPAIAEQFETHYKMLTRHADALPNSVHVNVLSVRHFLPCTDLHKTL